MEIKLCLNLQNYQKVIFSFSILMIKKEMQVKCNEYKKLNSIGTLFEKQVMKSYISCGVQCEPHHCSKETQSKIFTNSRGTQCSFEDFFSRPSKSCSTQYVQQDPSRGTQYADSDILNDRHADVFEDGDAKNILYSSSPFPCQIIPSRTGQQSKYVEKSLLRKSDSMFVHSSRSKVQNLRNKVQYISNNVSIHNDSEDSFDQMSNLNVCLDKESKRLRKIARKEIPSRKLDPSEINSSGSSSVVRKKRWETGTSSSTSGIGETSDSRSSYTESTEEYFEANMMQKKNIKQKRRLWTRSCDVATLSEDGDSVEFRTILPKIESVPGAQRSNVNKLHYHKTHRRNYTFAEELKIITYIAERNLYELVGGVRIWEDMEDNIKIERTWQSMKEHFRKKILPNINTFNISSKLKESFGKIKMR